MARSFIYNRPLDAKILFHPENSNHEFQFNTLLEIKKEVENDLSEMETEEAAPDSNCLNSDHESELRSTDSMNQYDPNEGSHRPKLVLKFRNLQRKSEQSNDYPKKKKKRKSRETIGTLLTVPQSCHEIDVASEDRITRSSLSGSRTKNISNPSQEETASNAEEKQDVWNLGRITRLRKNLDTLCESCGMCFNSDRHLQAHKRYYTADGEYHCTSCDIRFSHKYQLARHDKVAHSPVGNNAVYKFKCHLCIDRFERKASLIAHVTHLHNKQVVMFKRNSNKEILTSLPIPYARRKKKKKNKKKKRTSARKSKRARSRGLTIISNDEQTKVHTNSNSTHDFNEPIEIQSKEDNRLVDNNADTISTQRSINKSHSENTETLISEKYNKATATVRQELQTPIDNSNEKLARLKNTRDRIDAVSFNRRLQLFKKNRASPRLLERNEQRSLVQQKSRTDVNSLPVIVQPQLTGHLIDHLGNKVGKWCVSEQFLPPKSNPLKTIVSNSSDNDTINLATCSDQQLTQNKQLSAMDKSLHLKRGNCMNRVHLRSDDVDEGSKLLPQRRSLAEQVGSVSLDQVSKEFENAMENIKVEVDTDIELEFDDFGETHKSNVVNREEEEISDSNCESISLKMPGSSSKASVTDPLSLDSHNSANVLKSRGTQNNLKIKDLRVCLVKLENMLNLSTESDSPKLSSSKNDSLVKSETTYGAYPRPEQITNDLKVWQYYQRKNNNGNVNLGRGSRSVISKERVTKVRFRKVSANTNSWKKSRKAEREIVNIPEKRCLLCDAVFQLTFDVVSHYLSVHTKVGTQQCCLCRGSFKSLGKLRMHLAKHHRLVKKGLKIQCLICKKQIDVPNETRRCIDCNRSFENQLRDSQKKQFPVSTTSGRETSSVAIVDHESVKNDEKDVFPKTIERNYKNFQCSTCHSVFSNSIWLKYHLMKAHRNIKYGKYKNSKDIVKPKPQILPHPKSRGYESKPKNCCKSKNSLAKVNVGKRRAAQSKNLRGHDKLCKKKSSTRQRLKFCQIKNKREHLVRRHHVRDNPKVCFNNKCDVCGLNCCCRRSLKIHKTRYLTNGNKVCNICGLTFAWQHVLVMHMKRAHNPKVSFYGRVRCEICNQGFYGKKYLRIHLAHFHNIKYFQCRICRIRFDTCRSLNNHRQYYSKSLNRRCQTCGELFKCKYMLEYHIAQIHNREKIKAYKYFCDVCNFAFIDELLLQAHIGHFHNMHDRESETNGASMTIERLSENVELPPKTENYCSESTVSTNVSITRGEHANEIHPAQGIAEYVVGKTIRTHTSSEYKCGLCKLSFNDPYAILNHEWEFSNEGLYVCSVCNRKFMTNTLLKDHRIKHYQRNVIREYECYICMEDFSKLDHLKMHGMHLHGPQFVWDKNFKNTDVDHPSTLESRTKRDYHDNLKQISTDDAYATIGLMVSNESIQNGKILLFKKISNNKSSTELLRRHSNEDPYCCCFCKKNFSSESLLNEHMQKHAYRAYYSNLSRYLCLICKNKFRTNDILRAHVIHCHTSDRKEPNLSKPECSKVSIPVKPIDSKSRSDNGEAAIEINDNKVENVAANLRSKRGIANKVFNSKKSHGIQRSSSIPPSKKKKSSNSNSEVKIFRSDRARRIPIPREVEYKTENEFECKDSSGGNDKNSSKPELVESSYSGLTSHIEFDSKPEEVELFSVTVKSTKGMEKHACTICVATFNTVAQFREHFASIHVRNDKFVCTFCEGTFSTMSDLKEDLLKHGEEPWKHVCCDKTFPLNTDFVRHQLSHDRKSEKNWNKSHTQSSSSSIDKSNVNKADSLYKCEICEKVFPDFQIMLKHWDTCIDTNGLQCDLCIATFKTLNSFRLHKITHHEKQHNSNTVQNRRSFRLKKDRANRVSMQNNIVYDTRPRRRTTRRHSEDGNANKKSEGAAASVNKISKQNEPPRYGRITVKPFAKFSNDLEMNNEHQESNANDANELRSEFRSSFNMQSSIQEGVSEMIQNFTSVDKNQRKDFSEMNSNGSIPLSAVLRPAESITEVSLMDYQASDIDTCNANKNRLKHYLQVEDSNKIDKEYSIATDSSLRLRQGESREEGPGTSQQNTLTTTQNPSYLESTINNSIEIGNSKMDPTESPERFSSNDLEVARPLDSLSPPLNAAENYYICIQPVVDSSGNMINNVGAVTNDSGQRSPSKVDSGKLVSSLVALPLNPGVSQTYFLCVKPTTDNVPKLNSFETVPTNATNSKFRTRSRTPNILQKGVQNLSNDAVLNPVHATDIQRIAHNDQNSPNAASNHPILRRQLNSNEDTTVPTLSVNAGTSSGGNVILSQMTGTLQQDNSIDKSSSMKESAFGKQVVRCNFCNALFTEKTKLIEHMESHKTDNQCPACGVAFSNEIALQQHLPEHECSVCPKCNMITFFSDTVVSFEGSNKFCSVCGTVLPLPSRKLNCLSPNATRQLMKCGICLATFGRTSQMAAHFKMVHSSYVCGTCDSRFNTYYSLLNHIRTHSVEPCEAIQCKTCQKYFSNKSDLAMHSLTH